MHMYMERKRNIIFKSIQFILNLQTFQVLIYFRMQTCYIKDRIKGACQSKSNVILLGVRVTFYL